MILATTKHARHAKLPACLRDSVQQLGIDYGFKSKSGASWRHTVILTVSTSLLPAQVSVIKPDNFTPTVIQQTGDYLYAEFQSPTFGFIDDVEFWFPANKQKDGILEYRSASRIGESDGDINRKRIKAIRLELEKKGWKSIGFS